MSNPLALSQEQLPVHREASPAFQAITGNSADWHGESTLQRLSASDFSEETEEALRAVGWGDIPLFAGLDSALSSGALLMGNRGTSPVFGVLYSANK